MRDNRDLGFSSVLNGVFGNSSPGYRVISLFVQSSGVKGKSPDQGPTILVFSGTTRLVESLPVVLAFRSTLSCTTWRKWQLTLL